MRYHFVQGFYTSVMLVGSDNLTSTQVTAKSGSLAKKNGIWSKIDAVLNPDLENGFL